MSREVSTEWVEQKHPRIDGTDYRTYHMFKTIVNEFDGFKHIGRIEVAAFTPKIRKIKFNELIW